MSELPDDETDFSQFLRDIPFDDAISPEHRDALRERMLAEFDRHGLNEHSDAKSGWKKVWKEGAEIMKRPIPRLVAVTVACLLIAGIWLFAPGRQTTAQAFNKLAEAVVTAKTAKFQVQLKVTDLKYKGKDLSPFAAAGNQKLQAYFMAPSKYRYDLPVGVTLADFTPGKEQMEMLYAGQKQVMIMNIKGAEKGRKKLGFQNYFQQLQDLLANGDAQESKYRRVGEKEIDGRHAVGFQLDSPAAEVTLWGDPQTNTPVEIDFLYSGLPRTEVVMSHFEMNVDLPASMFDMTPPAGYKVHSIDVDASIPTEQSLLETLTLSSDLSGGEFPESLDTMGIMQLMIKHVTKDVAADHKKGVKDMSDEKVQQLMQKSITIGRGFQFVLDLPESADAHYAGKGIKRGTKDRPIFWYKPEETGKYRVIDADLSVKESETAPQIAGARRITNASKSATPPAAK
jgi:outer membrane lipoprotein-sorting protein